MHLMILFERRFAAMIAQQVQRQMAGPPARHERRRRDGFVIEQGFG
jgi:hypothetical protein